MFIHDDEWDVFSQQKPLILKSMKHGKQISKGKLKDASSKVSSMKELASQSPLVQSRFKMKNCNSDDSVLNLSHQDRAAKFNNSRIEGDVEASMPRKAVKRDVGAALALMKLANDASGLSKIRFHSHGENHKVSEIQDLNSDRASYDNHPQLAMKKTKHYKKFQQTAAENQMKQDGGRVCIPLSKVGCAAKRNQKKRKRKVGTDSSSHQPKYMNHDADAEHDNLHRTYEKLGSYKLTVKLGNKWWENVEACTRDGCYHVRSQEDLDEPPISSLKKHGLKKVKAKIGSLNRLTTDSPHSEGAVSNNVVLETKPLKKSGRTCNSPTLHTGFSFSMIHFLTAVRVAMTTPEAKDDVLTFSKRLEKRSFKGINSLKVHCQGRNGISTSQTEKKYLPSLTIHGIVERVRSNPGDPCVLEAQEPLQDLVRGALKIFSSKEAPLGAKGWKALTSYSKSSQSWSWRGPVSSKPDDAIEEQISPEAWGLPRRMVLKLVDSFANWLKSVQEVLHRIGNLPEPPVTLMMQPTINMEERLKVVRPRKIVATISPCSKEVRDYFRKEEALRYLVPNRAFSYTALDGRKSTVAPMRRCSGKPLLKGREHFMLKTDRPPHITVLCLVRDAAARLPASMGTRADICTLIRDSQYIVEDISDEQLNQVVSGALDRLHYENDPCVLFNGDTRVWVYLHRDREEDDFEDDGTSSMRKRKRE